MKTITQEQILSAVDAFAFSGRCTGITQNTDGHINETTVLTFRECGRDRRYLLHG